MPSNEKVIVRFYGSALTGKGNKYKPVTQEEEVKIIDKLSKLSLAPKIYYSDEDGRIESFIEGRLITMDEIISETISKKIAIKLAQIHSMKNVLDRQEALFTIETMRSFVSEFQNKKANQEQAYEMSESDSLIKEQVMSLDMKKETEWIEFLFKKVPSRIVFSHNDVHMKNMFVLNEKDDNSQLDILLMDYEYSCYN